ncbi:MAG: hypothetical protein LBG21_02085 [Campylobacteraceae bacterium]|jgi:hypothetical protein|nr:hypothetical protein [Campylobacteraceae bacterium]
MATPYEIDLLGTAARSTNFFISARIPEEEWDTNEDIKKLKYIKDVVLDSGLDRYLSYDSIMFAIDDIHKKYEDKMEID